VLQRAVSREPGFSRPGRTGRLVHFSRQVFEVSSLGITGASVTPNMPLFSICIPSSLLLSVGHLRVQKKSDR
jgi:hypothetical protein